MAGESNATLSSLFEKLRLGHLLKNCQHEKVAVYVDYNRPFPSYLLPLFQNESRCETIHMKMSFTCMSIFMQVKLIFICELFRM